MQFGRFPYSDPVSGLRTYCWRTLCLWHSTTCVDVSILVCLEISVSL